MISFIKTAEGHAINDCFRGASATWTRALRLLSFFGILVFSFPAFSVNTSCFDGRSFPQNKSLESKFSEALGGDSESSCEVFAYFQKNKKGGFEPMLWFKVFAKTENEFLLPRVYLAALYFEGKLDEDSWVDDVNESRQEGAHLLREIANDEFSPASVRLYEIFKSSSQRQQAIFWVGKAAKQGFPAAQFIYSTYDNTSRIQWLTKAAEQDYSPAQFVLAKYLYNSGEKEEAYEWLEKAAENEHPLAYMLLSEWARQEGKKEDSIQWLTEAAKDEFGPAQHTLYLLLKKEGKGKEARKWLEACAEGGAIPHCKLDLAALMLKEDDKGGQDKAVEMIKQLSRERFVPSYKYVGSYFGDRFFKILGGLKGKPDAETDKKLDRASKIMRNAFSQGILQGDPEAAIFLARTYTSDLITGPSRIQMKNAALSLLNEVTTSGKRALIEQGYSPWKINYKSLEKAREIVEGKAKEETQEQLNAIEKAVEQKKE